MKSDYFGAIVLEFFKFIKLINLGSLEKLVHQLYLKAGRVQDWNVIRHCSGLLRKIVDSLAPAISTILVHGKVVGYLLLYTKLIKHRLFYQIP